MSLVGSLGERLRVARREVDLTQVEAATYLGCAARTIASWEKGHTEPSASALEGLSRLYGVSVDVLLRGECWTNAAPWVLDEQTLGVGGDV